MGGGFPDAFGGGPDAGTQPGHPMLVDYVQVLTSGGGGDPGGPDPGTPGNRDAYGTIQAESYDGQGGVMTEKRSTWPLLPPSSNRPATLRNQVAK